MMLPQIERAIGQNDSLRTAAWYRGLTLSERQNSLPHSFTEGHSEAAQLRMNRWRTQKTFAGQKLFSEMLATQDITEQELFFLLGESVEDLQRRVARVPCWLEKLSQAQAAGHNKFLASGDLQASQSNPVEIMLRAVSPLIQTGLTRVRAVCSRLNDEFGTVPFNSAEVIASLLNNLTGQLIPLFSRTLALELNVARVQGRLHGNTAEERFADFGNQLANGAIWPLVEEYPVLARQAAIQIEQWADFSLEVVGRLCMDWEEICSNFSPDASPGQAVEISGGAGDTHRQGRSVLKLRFSGGLQLIYKPRSLALDAHFQELLTWINERGDHPPFRLTRLLERADYGWVEFIAANGCATEDEVKRFYERQGGYLALLYVLQATDFHYENLIAAGEHPVLIDLEALFHPSLAQPAQTHTDDPALDKLTRSVAMIGLLPQRVFGDDDHEGIDLSGLNGRAGQMSPRPSLSWQGIGTDQMRAVRERFIMPGHNNRPRLQDQDVNLLDYAADLLQGFTKIYRLVLREKEAFRAGPLNLFAGDQIRLLVRPTNAYAQLLQESTHPDLLRDALERERFFTMLWGAVEQQPGLAQLIPSELIDLWNGDIPMFTARPDSHDVFDSRHTRLSARLAESGMEKVAARLKEMNEVDLAQQQWIIRASLSSVPAGEGHLYWRGSSQTASVVPATREQLLQAARQIEEQLDHLAVRGPAGTNWLNLSFAGERAWSLTTTGIDLYDGLPGVILMLAYLGAVTGEMRYTTLAEASLEALQRKTPTFEGQLKRVGAFNGWGSLVYLYAHLFALWKDESLLSWATRAAEQIDALADDDCTFDVIGGSAGAVLSLLSLYQVTNSKEILKTAEKCGRRLIAAAQPSQGGLGWSGACGASVPLAGFSHGAAGIAYSLLALAAASGKESYGEVARAAITYERNLFSDEHQNWPDLRESGGGRYERTTWCHGAAGIGLARLSGLQYCWDATAVDEIRASIHTTLKRGFGLNHSLCHGDLGNLELLLSAALAMPDGEYSEQLNRLTGTVLGSLKEQGCLPGTPLGVATPGLMTGLAGIVYQLLRLAEPEVVPCVLTLDPPSSKQVIQSRVI